MDASHKIAVKILSGGRAGVMQEFEPAPELLIGRDADAHIRLHPTEDRMVGRRHARLLFHDDQWRIESLHGQGIFVRGQVLPLLAVLRESEVYQLGSHGPELRITLLGTCVPETIVDPSLRAQRAALRVQPRAEFDPAEMQASIQRASRRTVGRVSAVLVGLALLLTVAGWVTLGITTRGRKSAADIQRSCSGSVFRAAGSVRFRCPHSDVGLDQWQRYWVSSGSAFAVARQEDWVYALTNYHVFGAPARPDLSTDQVRAELADSAILRRWPMDWTAFTARLEDFASLGQHTAATSPSVQASAATQRYAYIDEITARCEFDLQDEAWRQVVVDGEFMPVELVDASPTADVVLFRFRSPGRRIEPLPLRTILPEDQATLAGRNVYVLGFPGSGDLPLRRSRDALTSKPAIAEGVLSDIKRDQVHGGYSIQVTAPINEGNSGGPLFDAWGNVVGINTWGPSKAETEGISYALTLQEALRMLRRHHVSWNEGTGR